MAPRDKPARSPRRSTRPTSKRRARSTPSFLLGLLLGILAATAAFWLYRRLPQPTSRKPSAISQPSTLPTPTPRSTLPPAPQPPAADNAANGPEAAPFGISEDVFEAGARLYGSRCASCHGTPRHAAAAHPAALQLWRPNPATHATGVSQQRPAVIYRNIAQGAPASGMPAYRGVLSSTQIWQLSLLLTSAGQELPDPVLHLLDKPTPLGVPAPVR